MEKLIQYSSDMIRLETTSTALTFAASGDEKKPASFHMIANTGANMNIRSWEDPVVIDMHGVAFEQKTPIYLNHDGNKIIGHSNSVSIVDGSMEIDGIISFQNGWARDVVNSGRLGFPWQASVGVYPEEVDWYSEDEEAEVNGRIEKGPIYVIRGGTLMEASFVDHGADSNTSTEIRAKSKKQNEEVCESRNNQDERKMNMPSNNEVKKENEEMIEAASVAPVVQEKQDKDVKASSSELDAGSQDQIQSMRSSVIAERERIDSIVKVSVGRDIELEKEAINAGWSPDRFELELLRKSRPAAPAVHAKTAEINGRVLEAVAMSASGRSFDSVKAMYDEQTIDASEKLRGIGLQEFCEIACNKSLPRFRRDAHGWLEAAFSTTSLPGILSNVANKALLDGFSYVDDSWRKICKISSVNDFKQQTRYRMNGSFKFEKVGPAGELQHGTISEQSFTQKADTHGIMFALTRQMIIDDDLGAFTEIPRNIGIGAAESISDAVWSLLLSNPSQSDGKTFFHADHHNLLTGSTTNLSVNSLTDAEVAFGEQTKPNGRPIGIMPSIILVPTALRVDAELLYKSTQVNETTTANSPKLKDNPHAGKFEVVTSTYLGNTSFSGNSKKAWYLLADPNRLPAIEVAFLNGMDRPHIERADADFNTLGMLFRGFIDFGVKEQDWRGIVKVKGEA